MMPSDKGSIGVFDSGYGGLTILRDIRRKLPEYDYLYLGDNARAPYGPRSFDIVYRFTLEAVTRLFEMGCPLVILACNTASAKALRSIQQNDLPHIDPTRRVLGVIRPTVEALGDVTTTGHVGIMATEGTVSSGSYSLEVEHLYPQIATYAQACPMLVPIVENGEQNTPGADYFISKYIGLLMSKSDEIDTVILACTHYPLLSDGIRHHLPANVTMLQQGPIVAESLSDYLMRHPEMERRLTRNATVEYLTTENPTKFDRQASMFVSDNVHSRQIRLDDRCDN